MTIHMRLAVLALAVLFPAGLAAQDQPAAAPEAEEAAETAPELPVGTPAETDPKPGETYVRDSFKDWQVRCVRFEDRPDPCQLYQLLNDAEGNSVAEINVFPVRDGGQVVAGATVVTPLETLLTAQLRLAVDGGQAKVYPYSFCSQVGCFARLGLTAEDVAHFKRGAKATITIVPAAAPDKTVSLDVSLAGFTAGFTALETPAE